MAYTVMIDGVPVRCETAEDAMELARLQADSGRATSKRAQDHPNGAGSRWSEHRTEAFFGTIKSQQRRLIEALLDHPDGRTHEQLQQLLGLQDNRALAGVFAGIWKNARKVGADPDDVYRKDIITIGDRQLYEYKASESFRRAAKAWKDAAGKK